MVRSVLVSAVVLSGLLSGAQMATAQTAAGWIHGRPAPAPLLAAGIPAFAALGGGLLARRLIRQRKDKA